MKILFVELRGYVSTLFAVILSLYYLTEKLNYHISNLVTFQGELSFHSDEKFRTVIK